MNASEYWASRGLARPQRRRGTLRAQRRWPLCSSHARFPGKQDQLLSTPKDARVLSKLDSHQLVSHWSPYWEFSIQSIPSSPILKILEGLLITKKKHLMTTDNFFALNPTCVLSLNLLHVYLILATSRPEST